MFQPWLRSVPIREFLAIVVFLMMAALSPVARFANAAESNADSSAVRAAAKEYSAAVQRADVDSLRKLWAPEGDLIDASGNTLKGEDLFRALAARASADSGAEEVAVQESSLRFVSPDVAIEDGVGAVGGSANGCGLTGRYSAVWVKRDGRWLLASLREAAVVPPTANDDLQSLEWLIGEWTGQTDNAVVLVSSHWSDGGKFIVRDFVVRSAGGTETGGTQRIGWDAAKGQIKCWMFDSQGGSGEGIWRRDGDSWVVNSNETLANGAVSSTSAIYTPLGEGRFVWEVKSAKVAGAELPPQRIEFTRAAND